MDDETLRLKQFIQKNIPFSKLQQVGFWPPKTKGTDYEVIAARVCQFFCYNSIYEYPEIDITYRTDNAINGKFRDTFNPDGELVLGDAFHISICGRRSQIKQLYRS